MSVKPGVTVLAALSGVPFIMVLGNSMLIPVLPAMKKALALNDFQLSMMITLFSVPAGLIIPLAGFLSDRYGRKVVIAPSLILYGLGGIVAGLAALFMDKGAYPVILGGRVLQGIGQHLLPWLYVVICSRVKSEVNPLALLRPQMEWGKY